MFSKFRCRNHKLPIEIGSRENVPRDMCLCKLCDSRELGDEYHYIFVCTFFQLSRNNFIDAIYTTRPSVVKMNTLMNAEGNVLLKLCKFIEVIMSAF